MNRRKLLLRNLMGLLLAVLICVYAFAAEKVMASREIGSGEIVKEKSGEVVKYKQTIRGRYYTLDFDREDYKQYYRTSYVNEEFWVEEGQEFRYTFPMGDTRVRYPVEEDDIKIKPYWTEKVELNGESWDNLCEISYIVHGENTITYKAYNDYMEYTIRYVDENQRSLARDVFYSKEGEIIHWNIDFNKVPGYEVKEIKYLRWVQPLKEKISFYFAGSTFMTVTMAKIKPEDEIAPEIYAGDIYFSLKTANSGKLTYEYLLDMFSAIDETDGQLNPVKRGAENGYYIEGYDSNAFTNASGDKMISLKVVAVDKAGNKREQTIRCYLVDTESRHIGEGRKKKVRFVAYERKVIQM